MNITGGENENKFQEALEQLGRKHERSVVYRDFMDYYIIQNSKHDTLPLGYTSEEMQLFHTAYTSFKDMMIELIEKHGWYDYIGEYYEEYILAGSKDYDLLYCLRQCIEMYLEEKEDKSE